MDDAFILNTTFLNSFFPPFFSQARSEPKPTSPLAINCKACEQPLIEIEFRTHYRIVCDNDRCHLFREHQGSRAKTPSPDLPAEKRDIANRRFLSHYQMSLEERKARYRFARNLGCSPRRAMELRGIPIEEIEELAGVKVEA